MAFICHPFQSCSAALWLEADDADQITAGLLPEKDTRTIGFVKYSLQYVSIILTFVGVSLYVSGAFFFGFYLAFYGATYESRIKNTFLLCYSLWAAPTFSFTYFIDFAAEQILFQGIKVTYFSFCLF